MFLLVHYGNIVCSDVVMWLPLKIQPIDFSGTWRSLLFGSVFSFCLYFVSVFASMCVCVHMHIQSWYLGSSLITSLVCWDYQWPPHLPRPGDLNSHPHAYKARTWSTGTRFCVSPLGNIQGYTTKPDYLFLWPARCICEGLHSKELGLFRV